MKIMEKFKDILKEKDLEELQSYINNLVTEQVELRVEEEKKKIDLAAEEYTKAKIVQEVEKEKQNIIRDYDTKLETLEENLVEQLDKFLDSEITENINEDVFEKVAINETFKPLIEGVKKLFEESYVDLDTEGHTLLREAKEEIEEYEEKLSTAISEKIELKSEVETLKVKSLIDEKSNGLTEDQKDRVNKFFEDKDYDEVNGKIDSFVELVCKDEHPVDEDEKVNEDVVEEDGLDDKVEEDKINEDTDVVLDRASRLL